MKLDIKNMSKKKQGIIIGALAVVLVLIIVIIAALCLKGCNNGKETAKGDNPSISETDKNGITGEGNGASDGSNGGGTEGGNSEAVNGENGGSTTNGDGSSGGSDIASNVTAQFKSVNSWESNGKKFVQYDVIINNNSSEDVKDWKVIILVKNGLSVSQSWNCSINASGSDLIIACGL